MKKAQPSVTPFSLLGQADDSGDDANTARVGVEPTSVYSSLEPRIVQHLEGTAALEWLELDWQWRRSHPIQFRCGRCGRVSTARTRCPGCRKRMISAANLRALRCAQFAGASPADLRVMAGEFLR